MSNKSTLHIPATPLDTDRLLKVLQSLLESLPGEPPDLTAIRTARLKELRIEIQSAIAKLQMFLPELDPIKQPPYVLDPSDPAVVGKLIADTLLIQERRVLEGISKFYGSGVYAIYYNGPFEAYKPLVGTETPIYVGKADPEEREAVTSIEQGVKLWSRLKDHRRSVDAATNLDLKDFECRFLVVRSAWQNTAEAYLINRFMPIWNNEAKVCFGFGKHGDDPETRSNARSPWDTIHPGRKWATRPGNKTYRFSATEIIRQIAEHFNEYPTTRTLEL